MTRATAILDPHFRETLEGSFSAVPTPIFATKYSFCSIFRDLQDWHSFAPLESKWEKPLHRSKLKSYTKMHQTIF